MEEDPKSSRLKANLIEQIFELLLTTVEENLEVEPCRLERMGKLVSIPPKPQRGHGLRIKTMSQHQRVCFELRTKQKQNLHKSKMISQ